MKTQLEQNKMQSAALLIVVIVNIILMMMMVENSEGLRIMESSSSPRKSNSGDDIPYFETSCGNHYQVGFEIGQRFKQRIQSMLFNQSLPFQQEILPFSKKSPQTIENLRQMNTFYFPQYFEEMKGVADGAQVSREWIFLLNVGVEIENYAESGKSDKQCADVFVSLKNFRTRTALLGHNEDADPYSKDYDYIVKTCIKSDDKSEPFIFTAYHYAGQLPGNAFAWNEKMAFTTNAQIPLVLPKFGKGVGRNFINRRIYESKNVTQVVQVLEKFAGILASGFATNIASLHNPNSASLYEMMSLENAPEVNGTIAMSTHTVNPFNLQSSTGPTFYFHVNAYRNLSVPQYLDPSSVHRTTRMEQFTKVETAEQILSILGDTQDKQYPIFRNGAQPDGVATVATVLYNLATGQVLVYNANPKYFEPIYKFNWLHKLD